MSNKTQLQTNNTQLASLIQTLQGKAAGSGGSSGGVETCSIRFSCKYSESYFNCPGVAIPCYTEAEGYYMEYAWSKTSGAMSNLPRTVSNVICGAKLYMMFYQTSKVACSNGCTLVRNNSSSSSTPGLVVIQAPTTSGATGEVVVTLC